MLHPADEAHIGVAHQDAWQEPSLSQDLEAVADAKNEAAALRVSPHSVHDRRSRCDGSTAQIIAIREAPRKHDKIDATREGMLTMPDDGRSNLSDLFQGTQCILLTVGAGKENYGGFHLSAMFSSLSGDGVGNQLLKSSLENFYLKIFNDLVGE
jgi:hypothetical protein